MAGNKPAINDNIESNDVNIISITLIVHVSSNTPIYDETMNVCNDIELTSINVDINSESKGILMTYNDVLSSNKELISVIQNNQDQMKSVISTVIEWKSFLNIMSSWCSF